MRIHFMLCSLILLATGCTHFSLRKHTVNQASTLTDLQYQQVLSNIAMFSCNPDAMAWHVKLDGGLVQVADQGAAGLGAQVLGAAELSPSLGAQRGVVNEWGVDPVVETDDLEMLELAYRKAVAPADPGNAIKYGIFDKICKISVTQHVILERKVSSAMIASLKEKNVDRPEELHKIALIEQQLIRLYDEVEKISREPITYEAYQQQIKAEADQTATADRGAEPQVEFLKMQIVKLTSNLCDLPFLPSYARAERNVAVIEQAQDKIEALYKLVESPEDGTANRFMIPWVCVGCKKDVPKHCVCGVGQYASCNGDCYAWITPGGQAMLREFTHVILALVPPDKQDITFPVGAAFVPSF